jgi:hypothetical protein
MLLVEVGYMLTSFAFMYNSGTTLSLTTLISRAAVLQAISFLHFYQLQTFTPLYFFTKETYPFE